MTEKGTFTRSIYNSAVLSAVSTVFILIFATMAAYAFGRLRFRFGGAVLAILVGTMIVPIFVVVISLFKVLRRPTSLIDTQARAGAGVRGHVDTLGDMAALHPGAGDADRARGGRIDRRLPALAGVRPDRRPADELGHRGGGGDHGAYRCGASS